MIAIDPGTHESAILVWNESGKVVCGEISPNERILANIRGVRDEKFACEMIASYGMPVGKEVFQTVLWIGRFMQAALERGSTFDLVYRQDIKIHHCHSSKAKDANVSQALRDRFGEKGTKKNPGPLFGVSSHLWSALAVATYWSDKQKTP